MNAFREVTTEEPHRARTRELLREHPEIKHLFGPTRWTIPLTALVTAVHLSLAGWLGEQPWWVAVVLSFVAGAFLSQALYAVLHECSHRLAARGRAANHLVSLVANLPLVLPMAVSYGHYHRMHHRHQGEPGRDPDLPGPIEHALARSGWLGKLVWHLAFPLFQVIRTTRMPRGPEVDGWLVANVVLQVAATAVIAWLAGPNALLYLGLSLYFTMSVHPISARLFQEHHVVHEDQETYSYYGPGNLLALNVGYHNEHHDFPAVPWTRLPALRRIATRTYDHALVSHRSWTALFVRFFADERLGPLSRVIRRPRPRRCVTDPDPGTGTESSAGGRANRSR